MSGLCCPGEYRVPGESGGGHLTKLGESEKTPLEERPPCSVLRDHSQMTVGKDQRNHRNKHIEACSVLH